MSNISCPLTYEVVFFVDGKNSCGFILWWISLKRCLTPQRPIWKSFRSFLPPCWLGLRALHQCVQHGFSSIPRWLFHDQVDGYTVSDLSHWASKGHQLEAIGQSLLSVWPLLGHFIFQLSMRIIQDTAQQQTTQNSCGYNQTKSYLLFF